MGISSRSGKALAQGVFYAAILALLVSRTVTTNISHDENQFIAPGQFLAYRGLAPYVDYAFTHMPYAVPLYALSAALSDYDLLAGRLLSTVFWLGCIFLMVAIGRSLSRTRGSEAQNPSWKRVLWEFALVLAFIHDATAQFILRTALNHSPATFLGLLAMLLFVRGIRQATESSRAAFWSGACIAAAGLTRFNYASLVVVLLAGWLIHGLLQNPRVWKAVVLRYGAGLAMASLPTMALAAMAPQHFYYTNAVYIRLNTIYYEVMLHRSGMDLASKLSGFGSVLLAEPMQVILYGVLLFTLFAALVRTRKNVRGLDIGRLTIAAAAVTMWMTAFAPTPALLQYMAAPLPFLFILLEAIGTELPRLPSAARLAGGLAVAAMVLAGTATKNPLADLAALGHPRQWPPVQVHELALSIRDQVPEGAVLTLQPMVPLEAGLEAYPFTATGPFLWRTSLLLTPERRAEYGVVSPHELAALLEAQPPAAVLVGFEEPNPGFERKDMGGLEKPLSDFAVRNGYTAVELRPPFWPRGLTLWLKR